MLQMDLMAPIAELIARHAAAGHLIDSGVGSGDCVAILLPNSVAWVESCFAINRAGAISVPISYDATESEVLYRLQDAGCKAIFVTDERAGLIAQLRDKVPLLACAVLVERGAVRGEGFRFEEFAATPARSAPRDPTEIEAPAFIIYTSGTTGRAKGVILTVHGMLWVIAACWAPIAALCEADVVLSPLPLFHSYALNLSVLGILAVGASEYILERFSTGEAVRLLSSGAYTLFPGVPTTFHYLLEATASQPDLQFAKLRLCISAGAIMPATLNRAFEARFGIKLLDGYGITETSTMVTMNWPSGSRVLGSCGLPVPGLAVRVVSPSSGEDVGFGEEGELIVRGPNVMPGYHNKPEETAAALRNGWYHTGDLAKCDRNGFLTITGRLKELIIRGGQNIAPAEIEEVVNLHDAVVDCAVIGIAHSHLGEVPALFVVPRSGRAAAEIDAILDHCRVHLSSYKVPSAVYFIEEIPRTGSGKIIRYKLREHLSPTSS
jgi:long-chain acyl-CoA synthetase